VKYAIEIVSGARPSYIKNGSDIPKVGERRGLH
jgi:hypothetical protein